MMLDELLPRLEGVDTCKAMCRRVIDLGVPRGLKLKLACQARDALGFDWTDNTVREWLKPVKHTAAREVHEREASRTSKVKHRDVASAYWKNRYAGDPHFAAAAKLRNRLNQAIQSHRKATGQHTQRRAKTLSLIGCTVPHLLSHLASLFEPGMTFETVHIDHVRPLASFERPDDPEVWHWTNLQPLWPQDNLSKGSLWAGERHRFKLAARDS